MEKSWRKERSIESDLFGHSIRAGGINSKTKGDNNEREAARFLFLWVKKRFIRSPSSGGRRLENNSSFCGDLVCEDEKFNFVFSVETKHLKDLVLTGNMSAKRCKVLTIWEQCVTDAVRAKKAPLLMLRKNGMPKGDYVVYFEYKYYEALLDHVEGLPLEAMWEEPATLVGVHSKDLLEIDYKLIEKIVSSHNG
jgi:hypothetical protein